MSDTKYREGRVSVEPEIVLEGNEVVLRSENLRPYCPVKIKVDDVITKPIRIALGARNFDQVLPDATGNLVCMLPTVNLKKGKHIISITFDYGKRTDKFTTSFEILEREPPDAFSGIEPELSDERERPDTWYYRQLDFYNRRFKKIGYIPDNIRQFQIQQIKASREKVIDEFSDPKKDRCFEPEFGICKWNPVGSGPVVVHHHWPGGFRAFAGRTLAIAIDHSNPNITFIGTANGGIWKSTDFGLRFFPKSDFNKSLAIGTIVIDPENSSRVFAGTGEYNNVGGGTYYGNGILRSTDGGETWTDLSTSPPFQRDEISRILFNPLVRNSQEMFLSSATGVYESIDGGLNWKQLRAGSASDLVVLTVTIGPPPTIKLIAAFYGSGLWTSTKTGVNWSSWVQITSSGIPAFVSGRIALGQSKNNPQTIYALFVGTGIEGIAKTVDGGSIWNPVTVRFNKTLSPTSSANLNHMHKVTVPAADLISAPSSHTYTTTSAGSPTHTHTVSFSALEIQNVAAGKNITKSTDPDATGHSHTFGFRIANQLWYNLHISVHPNDTNIIYLGEITEWKNSTGGGTFDKVDELHADQHSFAFDPVSPDDRIWLGSDGGIFRSDDKGNTWIHRNYLLDTLQYISISLHPKWGTVMLGGTQDNGTHRYSGNPAWEFVAGGDGGFTAIDPALPTRMYHGYTNNTFDRSDDAGITWKGKTGSITGNSEFYPPFTLDPSNSDNCYFGNEELWRSDNNADTWSAITDRLIGNITAIAVHPFDSGTIYVSTTAAHVYRVQWTGSTWLTTDITGPPIPLGVYTSDLVVDNSGNVWLTVSSVLWSESTGEFTNDHVYMLPRGSSTWQIRSNGLLKANPINTIVIDPSNSNTLFCGGDIGVFRSDDFGSNWYVWDEGLPHVPIYDIQIHTERGNGNGKQIYPEIRLLRAATHGRSVWERLIETRNECPPVDLYIRDNILDSGRLEPSPESSEHPFDPSVGVYHWESVDIKVGYPPVLHLDSIYDYASFEGKIDHVNPVPGKVNRVFVQVHNRGPNKASNVKLRAFFARVAGGLPPLPQDFWSAGKPFDSDPSGTDWLPVGPTLNLPYLDPAKPAVMPWAWLAPEDLPTHSCILALTTCDEDPLIGTGWFDVDGLVLQNKHVALKNLNPIKPRLDRLGPEEALILDFNNKAGTSPLFDLGVEWGSLPIDTTLLVAFEKFPQGKQVVLAKSEVLRELRINLVKGKEKFFKEKIHYKCGESKYLDLTSIYEINRNNDKFSTLPSIYIPPEKNVITMAINFILPKPIDNEIEFKILQMKDKKILGGVTYLFRR